MASPTSRQDPSCTEKSLVGFSMVWPPRLHIPILPRLPSPRPSQIVLASMPSVNPSGDRSYSLLNASS